MITEKDVHEGLKASQEANPDMAIEGVHFLLDEDREAWVPNGKPVKGPASITYTKQKNGKFKVEVEKL